MPGASAVRKGRFTASDSLTGWYHPPMTRIGVLVVALLGCGGRYPGGEATTPMPAKVAAAPAGDIEAAALPYHVLDGRTGRQLDEAAFWPRILKARAVCVGEEHPNPHHHWVQLHVIRQL